MKKTEETSAKMFIDLQKIIRVVNFGSNARENRQTLTQLLNRIELNEMGVLLQSIEKSATILEKAYQKKE